MRALLMVAMSGLALTTPYSVMGLQAQEPALGVNAQQTASLSGADRVAIEAVVSAFAESWSKHDMAAMHALDTQDVEWINVVGNEWDGLANVRRGHTNYHRFLAAKSTALVENVTARAIAPGVAIAVITFHFGGADPAGKAEDTRTRASAIMVKRGAAWKIVHFHNTVINPATQGAADPMNFDEATGLPKGAK